MSGPRVLVVEHQESCPPALFGGWLTDAGCVLEVCRPYLGGALPSLPSYDAVLVLGGDMGADDDETHAWLGPLKEGIREAVAAGTPLLGICLGHQLIASALGGRVARNPHGLAVGLRPVGWTGAATDDDWVGAPSGAERAVHWNRDVVLDMPPGSEVLALSPDGEVQVVRFGRRAWGIQAHPEVDTELVRRWAADDRDDHVSMGLDQESVLAEITASAAELEAHWRPMVVRFAEVAGR
ncbi:MAG: type 1 glutamine amidotransferase [Nocardioides sp.]|nr:type 1 glutamine amidotransferase [Nocardioides sp.]